MKREWIFQTCSNVEGENNYRFLAENIRDIIWTINEQKKISYISPSVKKVMGYNPSDIKEKEIHNILTPKSLLLLEKTLDNVSVSETKSQSIVTLDLEYLHINGESIWAETVVTLFRNADNSFSGCIGVARDITQRRQSELTMLRLVAAIEATNEGIAITDNESNILYSNEAIQGMIGCNEQKLLGRPLISMFDKNDKKHIDDIRTCLENPKEWRGRLHFMNNAEKITFLDISLTPIRRVVGDGEQQEFVFVFRDVSREVQLEQHVRRQQKLEAIGTLAGGVAHDFNNILVPITINTELALLDVPSGNETSRLLEEVLTAAERGKDLVQQILFFSRPGEGQVRELNVVPIIKEVMKFMRATLPETIRISTNIKMKKSIVMADPTHIHQIIMNLCSNAADAMKDSSGELQVILDHFIVDDQIAAAHPGLEPGDYVNITVGDTGKGISPEILDKIFDPFFTTKKESEGSGMGLSIVHSIVNSYKGCVILYSEPGQGTTVNILLPRLETFPKQERVSKIDFHGGSEKILMVDDEKQVVDSGKTMLERLGYQVIGVTSSATALELFENNPDDYDLVITDQTMPGFTGIELAEKIHEIKNTIPIILCSGYSSVTERDVSQMNNICKCIMKPFSIRNLATIVRSVLDGEN